MSNNMSNNARYLEQLMAMAVTQPVYLCTFYATLLDATVYILGGNLLPQPDLTPLRQEIRWRRGGRRDLMPGTGVLVQHWCLDDGTRFLPCFTSLSALRAAIDKDSAYLALRARDLFAMTSGNTLILNPCLPVSKILWPSDIEMLLEQDAMDIRNCVLSMPEHYPQSLAEALARTLSRHPEVGRAWLAQVVNEPAAKHHLVLALEVDGDAEDVLRETGLAASQYVTDSQLLDLCRVQVDRAGLAEEFFAETPPFYERVWGRKLAMSPDTIGHA
ncbi:enhanced serine sensitivity protein SseB C-terminal domain-containing protein [Alcanivorax sp. JB21]|uniref:enhanced serine sensitivity protein SseB C-terminal domain-containing protein n=1 Tax=Alcanivorax limicola TaxID=2874102 RepID=UPI001CBC2E44|nr:enhanced serine sensitivity protein SseB C-terminal domain-containing protein [Alcanivorax limicola]MBZ2187664.1 enhanced serine sensitivity protein SseB C-terminal domain-containing protein [Alcanivorax limicola]